MWINMKTKRTAIRNGNLGGVQIKIHRFFLESRAEAKVLQQQSLKRTFLFFLQPQNNMD